MKFYLKPMTVVVTLLTHVFNTSYTSQETGLSDLPKDNISQIVSCLFPQDEFNLASTNRQQWTLLQQRDQEC